MVAGASSGIGLGVALALAAEGARVTMAARGAERLARAVDEVQDAGGQATALELDISDVEATAEAVRARGPFGILVNSAGVARHGPAIGVDPETFDHVAAINLRGAFFLTRAVAGGLIEAGQPGTLVNISSQMGHVGGIDRAVYCATKHAVEGFTKAMALEFGPHGIRVNTVCPTFIRTPLTEATFRDPERRQWIERKVVLGREGRVEDVAGAVLYLVSDASALVTGTALRVDGGWTAH